MWPRAVDCGVALAGLVMALLLYAHAAPLPRPVLTLAAGTVVTAADGTILWRDTAAGVRIPITLDRISPAMVEATIAAEDQRFREHPGVDALAVARAAVRFPWEQSGASTISQQLSRLLYLDPGENVVLRKAREAQLATQLEARYSKDEILELYLNAVYFGRGAYGIEAAARVYFGISAANLDVARAAFLAGLIQSPALGDAAGAEAMTRQHYVLDRMVATGALTELERAAASTAQLELRAALEQPIAGHFVALAREESRRLVPELDDRVGVVIETTLDAGLQATAERQALLQLSRLERNDAGTAAIVVLDPRDGRILAMAGNVSTAGAGTEFNMALEPRQPGSALKPFLYSLAIEDGFTAASPLLDVPLTFGSGDSGYSPQNYDRQFRGITTLRTALASSLNVPAVWMLEQVGTARFAERLRAFGIDTPLDPASHDLALALGSADVSLLDLTAAYGAFANGGELHRPVAVTRIRDGEGNVLYERPEPTGRAVVSPGLAFLIADILADDGARSAGFGAGSILQLPFPAAVKTGTTTDFHDNWTVGYTPRQVVGVWVGNVDNRPMQHISGVDGAAPIWAEVMKATRAVQGGATFQAPPSMVRQEVCAPTGLIPGANCPTSQIDWFLPGTAPIEQEAYYVRDAGGQLAIDPPAAAEPWLALGGYPIADSSAAPAALAIASPADGSVLYVAPELATQEVAVRMDCHSATSGVEVFVDGEQVAAVVGCPEHLSVPLEPGTHILVARASVLGTDVEASITYEVRR